MTVSLALRGNPRIPESTRTQILRVAEEIGYERDPALASLVAYRQEGAADRHRATIAVLTNWPNELGWKQMGSGRKIVAGMEFSAKTHGYRLETVWLRQPGYSPEQILRPLLYRQIQGVILAPLLLEVPLPDLDLSRFSVIALEPTLGQPNFHFVAPSYFTAIGTAWSRLLELGHRRIGMVLTEESAERVRHRWDAAHSIEQRRPPAKERIPTLLVHDPDRYEKELEPWMSKYKPDVILSKHTYALKCIRSIGWRVPEDVSYASLNVDDEPAGTAGINQNREIMGNMAVDILHSLILRNRRGEQEHVTGTVVNGTWQEGITVCPRPVEIT
jgi:LacI family transcriptional regulator